MPIILSDRYDLEKIIAEERENWVFKIIKGFGINVDKKTAFEMREELLSNRIEIINNLYDNSVEIKKDGLIIKKWCRPEFKQKYDEGGLYYELYIQDE